MLILSFGDQPKEPALASLYVCQTFFNEANDLWISHIMFNFANILDVFRFMLTTPSNKVSLIRHLTMTAHNFDDMAIGPANASRLQRMYLLKNMFNRLKGSSIEALSLNTLTIYDQTSYFELHAAGWIYATGFSYDRGGPDPLCLRLENRWWNSETHKRVNMCLLSHGWKELRVVCKKEHLNLNYWQDVESGVPHAKSRVPQPIEPRFSRIKHNVAWNIFLKDSPVDSELVVFLAENSVITELYFHHCKESDSQLPVQSGEASQIGAIAGPEVAEVCKNGANIFFIAKHGRGGHPQPAIDTDDDSSGPQRCKLSDMLRLLGVWGARV